MVLETEIIKSWGGREKVLRDKNEIGRHLKGDVETKYNENSMESTRVI